MERWRKARSFGNLHLRISSKTLTLYMTRLFMLVLFIYILIPESGNAQLNNDKLGAWYMYFINANFNNSQCGFQGDVQYRNWNNLPRERRLPFFCKDFGLSLLLSGEGQG